MSTVEFNYCSLIYGDRSEHDNNPKEKKNSLLWQNLFFSPFKIQSTMYVISFFYPQEHDQSEREANVFELTAEKPVTLGRNKITKDCEIINDINIRHDRTISGRHGRIIIENGLPYYESISESDSRSSWMMVRNKSYKIKKGLRYELGISHYLKVRSMDKYRLILELFRETSKEDEILLEITIDDKKTRAEIGKKDCCLSKDDNDRKNIDDKHYRVEKKDDEYLIKDISSSTKNNGYIRLSKDAKVFINEEIIMRFGDDTAQYKINCDAFE